LSYGVSDFTIVFHILHKRHTVKKNVI
jgi:hypothetical protein